MLLLKILSWLLNYLHIIFSFHNYFQNIYIYTLSRDKNEIKCNFIIKQRKSMLRDIMLYNYKWILRRRKKKRNYSWISFAIILLSSGIKLKSFGKIEMARFTPERSPRLALEDARLTFRATPCDAHVPIFFRTIAQTRGHRLTQPANSFEIHRSWKSLDRIQFAGREERKKEKKK